MAGRDGSAAGQTYLVEHYGPGVPVEMLERWAGRVREAADAMARDGKRVRYLSSTLVPADESLLCLLEAAREELVHDVCARAGVSFERLSTVISDGAGRERSARERNQREET